MDVGVKVEGQKVTFNPFTEEFTVIVNVEGNETIFKAKSVRDLQKKVDEALKTEYPQAIEIGFLHVPFLHVFKVVKKGERYYKVNTVGKKKRVDNYYLRMYDEEKYNRLEEIRNTINMLYEEWDKIKTSLPKLEQQSSIKLLKDK